MRGYPFAPRKLYDQFSSYFPFATVDVLVFRNNSFILTKRTIPPYRGLWHLPGGIIRKGERMERAAKRAVKNELNLDISLGRFIGAYENPVRTRHDITHLFTAIIAHGNIDTDFQSSAAKFFDKIPTNTIPYHKEMILDAQKILRRHKSV